MTKIFILKQINYQLFDFNDYFFKKTFFFKINTLSLHNQKKNIL